MGRKNSFISYFESFISLFSSFIELFLFLYISNNQHFKSTIQSGKNFGCFVHWFEKPRSNN